MVELNNRPELPDIFPENDVTVNGEEHIFEVNTLDNSTRPKYEYTLNKAPVKAVQSIQGTDQNGDSRTFSNGADYQLTAKTNEVQDEFTYSVEKETYLLRYRHDANTDIVQDEAGNQYSNGTDYTIDNSDQHYGDELEWIDGGSSPDNTASFTVNYDVTFADSVIQWQQDANNIPQDGSAFYVTYRADSIISRYLDTHEESLDDVEKALQEVINNKFVDSASGEALDRLGALFGPTIGKRRGRTDVQYRIYLKSIVQSFVSRGTVNGIKLAISAATDVPLEDIMINENFENVEYEVSVIPNTPVTVQLLEEVAEIADPSGVQQIRTRFTPEADVTAIDETVAFTEGQQIPDELTVDDSVAFPRVNFTDTTGIDDSTATNPNKFDAGTDTVSSDDSTTSSTASVTWGNDWGTFDWAGSVE